MIPRIECVAQPVAQKVEAQDDQEDRKSRPHRQPRRLRHEVLGRVQHRPPGGRGRLLANQSLAELTWFRVGGPAQVLFTPADEADLAYFLKRLPRELPVYVVGVGSNLIVRDGGMPGVVIRLAPRAFGETSADGDVVTAGAAALDKRVAETAAAANIGGMEFFFGIPGTIGGALRMNAGANGGETKDVLVEATGVSRDGTRHTFGNAEMKFVYRNSGVDASVIFTSARFRGRIDRKSVV